MDTTTARTASRWIAAIAVAAAAFVSISVSASAQAEQQVTVINATIEEVALVEWGIAQYDAAGIEIRPITVVFHTQEEGWEPCNGAVAYYYSETRTVDMCNSTRPQHEQRHWILHELGHAHTFDTMGNDDVERFVAQSHSDSWNDHDHRWQNRGQERAADIVAWGLNPGPSEIYWMQDLPCNQRADLFHDLTDLEIAHDEC